MADPVIFISSSSDLADSRRALETDLESWLRRNGVIDVMMPYLWEEATNNGRMVSERLSIQAQLPDTSSHDVPFTICMFGERCGVPLAGELPAEWIQRIEPWRADANGAGLFHPWPESPSEQDAVLKLGGFPLTGTIFELISAHSVDQRFDNLLAGYIASSAVSPTTAAEDVVFNHGKWRQRLESTKDAHTKFSIRELTTIREEVYLPQVQGLINLLKYMAARGTPIRRYSTEEALQKDIINIAKEKLRRHFGFTSPNNPFKSTLEHWRIDDELPLPGRSRLIDEIVHALEDARRRKRTTLPLITGKSGCGKSSLLHRGVLARRREQGDIVVQFRPLDLLDPTGQKDELAVLWSKIGEAVGDPALLTFTPKMFNRQKRLADHLDKILVRDGRYILLGIDQFEEILDDLRLTKASKGKGWWAVMKFFQALGQSHRVQLIATLESSRSKTFDNLKIAEFLSRHQERHNADVRESDVAEIAKQGFERAGLSLDPTLIEEIKKKWAEFEQDPLQAGTSASPLPLACLWLSKLYELFEDRATNGRHNANDGSIKAQFGSDRAAVLSLEDLGEEGVAFDKTIAELAERAWVAAEKEPISEPISNEDARTLDNFLSPLVGLDEDRHMRLLAVAPQGGDASTTALRASFKSYRLLVPVISAQQKGQATGANTMLRLVHQSAIDRWTPATNWFNTRTDYLRVENSLHLDAKRWDRDGSPRVAASRQQIQHAAQVLSGNAADWMNRSADLLGQDDRRLKSFAIHLFSQAKEPAEIIQNGLGVKMFVHLAAQYHLVDVLTRFSRVDPGCLGLLSQDGRNSLMYAAWSDGPAVPLLLQNGVSLQPEASGWSALEPAIQTGSNKNFLAMVKNVSALNAPIAPGGINMLHRAATHGNNFVIEHLIELSKGASAPALDLEKRCEAERSALHYAAMAGKGRSFKLLLSETAVESVDKWGFTPLTLAAVNGHVNIIVDFFHSADIGDDAKNRILSMRTNDGLSIAMVAATHKRAEVLRLLLQEFPETANVPADEARTLLHLAVDWDAYYPINDDDRIRARQTVEVLLDHGLDPTAKDKSGRTPFEIADRFEDARRVLRADPRWPTDYDMLTAGMRAADLTSRKLERVLSLVRSAPQSLTDSHNGQTGLELLIRAKNERALTVLLEEKLLGDDQLQAEADKITQIADQALAGSESGWSRRQPTNLYWVAERTGTCEARALRSILIQRSVAMGKCGPALERLLNAALADDDAQDQVNWLVAAGFTALRGPGKLGATTFHALATVGKLEEFEKLAKLHRFKLPLDSWGRRPSQSASASLARKFEALENDLFDAAQVVGDLPVERSSSTFHDFAAKGDVRSFQRQARGIRMPIPRDADGRKPSEVAPDEMRAEIARIEEEYFVREN